MKIEIMEYNPDWTKNFEEEKIKLLHFFGSHAVAIEHIGSTAIPNQRAKPVIDIFIRRFKHETQQGGSCVDFFA